MFPSASRDQGVGPTGAAPFISELLNEDVASRPHPLGLVRIVAADLVRG